MLGFKDIPDQLNPIGKHAYELVDNYWRIANSTFQAEIREITQGQMTEYLNKAERLGVLHLVDPHRLIKVGCDLNDIRMVSTTEKKYNWDLEVFSDPMLKRFALIDTDPDKMMCDITKNYYRALRVNETDPYESYMAYNHFPDFIDIRTIDGIRVNPPRIYNENELYLEVVRLATKRRHLIAKIKNPKRYFANPKVYEKSIFYVGKGNNMDKQFYDRYFSNCYVICLANHGYRGVRSRIEQWVWEQHVMRYYRRQETRTLLNNLILDDDGIYCKILVPNTVNEFGILNFILDIRNFQIFDGAIETAGYKHFNMLNYYKDFEEIVHPLYKQKLIKEGVLTGG